MVDVVEVYALNIYLFECMSMRLIILKCQAFSLWEVFAKRQRHVIILFLFLGIDSRRNFLDKAAAISCCMELQLSYFLKNNNKLSVIGKHNVL